MGLSNADVVETVSDISLASLAQTLTAKTLCEIGHPCESQGFIFLFLCHLA